MPVRTRCAICNQPIIRGQMATRVLVELVTDAADDNDDSEYWSKVRDWECVCAMHLRCARNTLDNGGEIPYGEEIQELDLEVRDEGPKVPPLKLVQGKGA